MSDRPKPGEDEDDLLRLQAEFLQKDSNASSGVSIKRPDKRGKAHVHVSERDIVRMDMSDDPGLKAAPSKKSKFRMERDSKATSANVTAKDEFMEEDNIEDVFEKKETGIAAVLSSIIERDTQNERISAPYLTGQGFPSVIRNDCINQKASMSESSASHGGKKKKSLFALHVEAKSSQHFGVPLSQLPLRKKDSPMSCSSSKSDPIEDKSVIVSGKGLSVSHDQSESQSIHEENRQKLSSMTEQEILEEQFKLLESADPKVLQFLKGRRPKSKSDSNSQAQEMSEVSPTLFKSMKKKIEDKGERDLNLPIKPSSEWLNMDVIEKEKMEWMTDLPPPDSVSSQTGKSARFDFEGNVLAVDSDIPVNLGLHHHGDEPERAGYTLQELLTLARSSNLQQRILSLHTVAKIIRKAKSGCLVDKIESPLIPALLDGGIVILIRLSLDDPAEGIVFATIDALHSLLCSPLDQEAVSKTWIQHLGNVLPSLIPSKTLQKQTEPEEEDEENQEQETDADVAKRDVIQALVMRMQLLRRFHYTLHSMRPQAVIVMNMMDILARVAQHSTSMAYEISKQKDLISKIFKEFLPTAWNPQNPNEAVSNVHGLPVPSALRMVRCLCQAGRHITSNLISNYHLLTILLRYLAVDMKGLNLPILEATNLQTEALAVWRVCVTYGFGLQVFFDIYSENVKRINKIEEQWNNAALKKDIEGDSVVKEAGLVCVFERMLYVMEKKSPGQQSEMFGPTINWSHVKCLYQPIRTCVCNMLNLIGQSYPVEKYNLMLPTVCINFMASFLETEGDQPDIDVLSRAEDIENFFQGCLGPYLSSHSLSTLLDNLCPFSNILSTSQKLKEMTPNLPSMGVHWNFTEESHLPSGQDGKELNYPILREHSPFGFTVSVFRLALSICKRHKGLIEKLIPPLVDNPSLLAYMRKVCQKPDSTFNMSHWTRIENMLHFLWLKCCTLKPCTDISLAHRVALRLLSRLQEGDEHLIHDLFTSTIFSPSFIREGEDSQLTSQAMENLNLSESLYLMSATQEEINVSKSHLLREAFTSLANIRGHYLMALGGMEKVVVQSRNLYSGKSSAIQSQLLPSHCESVMPKDWIYLPLIHVYNKSQQMKNVSSGSASSKDISMVTSVLQWNYLYEVWRPLEIEHVSITTKISRIMCAFLAGNDLFLGKKVQSFLAGLLRQFVCPRLLNALNFEEKVPGISSFYDLYQEFLEHYESVSFGDPVFGLYVLLAMQQKHSSLYRKAIWGERRKLLRTLRVTFHDSMIPVSNFLEPEEEDVELLQLYLHALVTKSVQSTWSPIMFLVAIHHVNRFLFVTFDDGKKDVRNHMWKIIHDNPDKISSVIHYKHFNVQANNGMELYEELPENRKTVVDMHMAANSR